MVADTRGPLASIFTHSVNDAGGSVPGVARRRHRRVRGSGSTVRRLAGGDEAGRCSLFRPLHQQPRPVAVEAGDGIVMITSDGVTRVADRGNSPLETFMFPSINDQG